MEENEKNVNIDTEDLKNETVNTVNQFKDTIKNVDLKNDVVETKGFIKDFVKNPLNKIKEVAKAEEKTFLKIAIFMLAIWMIALLIPEIPDIKYYKSRIFKYILMLLKTAVAPLLGVITLSSGIYILNKEEKKPLSKIIVAVVIAKIPVIIANVIAILYLISTDVYKIVAPISAFCSIISTVLVYFAIKNLSNSENAEDAFKIFVKAEAIFYVVYLVLSFLGIYIK